MQLSYALPYYLIINALTQAVTLPGSIQGLTSLNVSTRLSKHNLREYCQHSLCTISLFSVIITLCNI